MLGYPPTSDVRGTVSFFDFDVWLGGHRDGVCLLHTECFLAPINFPMAQRASPDSQGLNISMKMVCSAGNTSVTPSRRAPSASPSDRYRPSTAVRRCRSPSDGAFNMSSIPHNNRSLGMRRSKRSGLEVKVGTDNRLLSYGEAASPSLFT